MAQVGVGDFLSDRLLVSEWTGAAELNQPRVDIVHNNIADAPILEYQPIQAQPHRILPPWELK